MFHAMSTGALADSRLYPSLHILRSRQKYPLVDSSSMESLARVPHAILARAGCVKDFYMEG